MPKLPAHGTVARYRLELKAKKTCDKCKAANSRARRAQRAQAKMPAKRPVLTLVRDTHSAHTNVHTEEPDAPPVAENGADYHEVPAWTATVKAFLDDIDQISPETPFFNSLKQAGLVLAREIDDVNSRAPKGPLVKQLVDVVRELKGKGDGDGPSFDDFLTDLLREPTLAPSSDRDA